MNDKDKCKGCSGRKTVKESKVKEIHVDKGMVDGQRIPLRGEGDQIVGSHSHYLVVTIWYYTMHQLTLYVLLCH